MSDLKFDRDIQVILRRLSKLPKDYDKDRKSLLKKAAKPVMLAIKSKVRVGDKPHKRYTKGGKLAGVYYPGNLKRSVRILKFRKSKDLFVGPKLGKSGSSTGVYKGNKIDGYYGHMLEFGTVNYKNGAKPFMRPGFAQSKGRAQQIIRSGSERILRRYAARYKGT